MCLGCLGSGMDAGLEKGFGALIGRLMDIVHRASDINWIRIHVPWECTSVFGKVTIL